jgi:formylglycine-generating enzyme required for sulfatase activity
MTVADWMSEPLADTMVRIPGGTFLMGSDRHYPEERPTHRVEVASFWIDKYAVTNADFARFVTATGHATLAERPLDLSLYPNAQPELAVPGAAVFEMTAGPVDTRGIGPQIGYNFAAGGVSIYPNLRGYTEFESYRRLQGHAVYATVSVPLSAIFQGHSQ